MLEVSPFFLTLTPGIPQDYCYLWKPELIKFEVTSNSLIGLTSYSISISLMYLARKREKLLQLLFFLLSISMIVGGTSHLLKIWTIWHPNYELAVLFNAITASIFLCIAVILVLFNSQIEALTISTYLEVVNHPLKPNNKKEQSAKAEQNQTEPTLAFHRENSSLTVANPALGDAEQFTSLRKQVEEQLAKQEHTLRTILDNAPIWIWMTDTKGQIQFVNKTFCENLGVPESRFLEVPHYSEILGEQEAANFMAADAVCWSQDRPHQSEQVIKFVDGKYHDLAIFKAKIKDKYGQGIGLIGLALDVTERKQVQLALQQSEARFRELAQHEELLNRLASQIRNSLDLDTILETAVTEIRNLLQIDRCYFLWYRSGEEGEQVQVEANFQEGMDDFYSEQRPTQELKPKFLNTGYWEIVNEAKDLTFSSYLGKYSVKELGFWTERLLQLEIISVDDANTVSDPWLRDFVVSFSLVSVLMLPIQTQSGEIGVLGCGHHSCVRSWRDSELELLVGVINQLAIAIDQAELYNQTREVAFHAQAQAEKLERTLQQLQKTQSHLIQTEKMSSLGQMVAGVAHEINNPINFIYGNIVYASQYALDLLSLVELYEQQYPEPPSEIKAQIATIDLEFIKIDLPKLLSSMKVGAERIRQIVLSLRNFSRLDESEVKKVNIHEGIDSTLLILQSRLKEKADCYGITVMKEYGNLPLVECYAGQLNQVFMNLLANAIDALEEVRAKQQGEEGATAPKTALPTIWIRTEVLEDDAATGDSALSNHLTIRIVDNGPGMPEEVRNKLFDPFFTTKPVGSGTGLGLSISYQIVVEKHGGRLYCLSEPGEGAEFTIEIPIRQQNDKQLNSVAVDQTQ